MANIEQIADELGKMTVLEASQLSKLLQEQWGVSAAAPMAVAAMPGAAGAAPGGAAPPRKKKEVRRHPGAARGKKNPGTKSLARHTGARPEAAQGPRSRAP